jgi:lipopolysaccharide/colanic/teichoic acid biosynthesis glycosyltransferase
VMRRLIDICCAGAALIVLTPLFLLTSLAIVLESSGNPFYGGWRAGKDGKPFRMWKFRTMVKGADRLGCITAPQDARITVVGRFLRATKIDELPQFLNLLVGDLTLIGPRPEDPDIVKLFTLEQRETLKVRPGITGPGQLYYTTDQAHTIPKGAEPQQFYIDHLLGEKLQIDLQYLRNRTLFADCRVVMQTVALIFKAVANTTFGWRAGKLEVRSSTSRDAL